MKLGEAAITLTHEIDWLTDTLALVIYFADGKEIARIVVDTEEEELDDYRTS